MNKLFKLICLLFFVTTNAQIHEIGVFVGGSNFVGDVGVTDYIYPKKLAFGLLYKWNKSPRHSYRISIAQSTLMGNDRKSDDPSRKQRKYYFENSIKEVSLGLEFNFFDFNLHTLKRKLTPYVYTGLSYFRYDQLYVASGITQFESKSGAFALPLNIGIKSNITHSLILAAEVATRYTYTDNLDGSNPKNVSLKPFRFGNINNNDWYVFSGITLTYTFGDDPCYCVK